jgi:hypothetical protein
MKKLLLAALIVLPMTAWGQDFSFDARASVEVNAKLAKGLHIGVTEELRTGGGCTKLGSMRTDVSLTYKPVQFLKVGVGYVNINPYKTDKTIELADDTEQSYTGFWNPRHRFYADVTGHLKLGLFSLSLKEKLQFTHNSDYDANPYQSTRNLLALKTKLGAKYNGWNHVTPGLSLEIRTPLNEPWGAVSGSELTSGSGKKYYNYTHTGYTHAYINRLRLCAEAEIEFSRHHSLEPYVLLDYDMDYEIDTNGPSNWAEDGVRLFSATTGWQYGWNLIAGLKYTFSF